MTMTANPDLGQEIKEAMSRVIADIALPPNPRGASKRGIVICAGGTRYFSNAWVAVKLLRHHGCELPIELWALSEAEFDVHMRDLADSLGVRVRYGGDALSGEGKDGLPGRWQWALKPYALVHSAFDEVLYLDADNFPVRDPSDLFESPAYRNEGCLFWPDIRMAAKDNPIWEAMEVPYRIEPEFETGQILVHKRRCWEPLQLALWMNLRSDYFYHLIWGDKDTFRFAWHKYGRPFAMMPFPAQVLRLPGEAGGIAAMCQHDFDGNWLFQHRNMAKWSLLGENLRIPGFLFDAECRKFLAELREQWNGRVNGAARSAMSTQEDGGGRADARAALENGVWLLEDRRPAAQGCCLPEVEWSERRFPNPWWSPEPSAPPKDADLQDERQQWARAKRFRCTELKFLSDSVVGGAGPEFSWWELKPGPGGSGLVLDLQSEEGSATSFEQGSDGSWRGWAKGTDGNKHLVRLMRLESVYPEEATAQPLNGNRPAVPVHLANHAYGIGDAITGLYAAAGLVKAGFSVVYHTRFPEWLSRASLAGLTITGAAPPEEAVDLNADYLEQIRYGGDKARWYSMLAAAVLPGEGRPGTGIAAPPQAPARPQIDVALADPVLDLSNYVLLAPFAAHASRDWPESHWRRLASLLNEAGYEVVAIGVKRDETRLRRTFERTYAYWVLDQSPEWVTAAMLEAECVVGPDSGMVHLAGLLGVPAVCVHSHLPSAFLFGSAPTVSSVTPGTECQFCRWQADRGYNEICADACSALAAVSPEQVLDSIRSERIAEVQERLRRRVEEETRRAEREGESGASRRVEIVTNKADVIAYTLEPNCGMGEAAEANIRAMRELGLTVEHRHWQGEIAMEPALGDPDQIFYHHWHPHSHLTQGMWRYYLPAKGSGARHVAYWAYEIEGDLPDAFRAAASFISEVWTPSHFCKRIFEATGLPVHVVPHAVPSVERLGELPSTSGKAPFTVLTLFDAWSRFGRKNPHAVIRVFQKAFPDRHDVRLLLKGRYMNPEQFNDLQMNSGWDSRIRVVNEFLSESERDRLFASADVYLGLQRSEGFGLNLARSLGMGLPVITTGWSGLTDFCTAENSFLVPYSLERAQLHESEYQGEGIWAEPDEEAAATRLARVSEMVASGDERLLTMRQAGRALIGDKFGAEALRENLLGRFEVLGVPPKIQRAPRSQPFA